LTPLRSALTPSAASRGRGRFELDLASGLRLRRLDLKAPFLSQLSLPPDGVGVGMVEAARGALGHWLTIRDGEIANYQIVPPRTWSFSPRDGAGVAGPLEGALEGVEAGARGAKAAVVQHVVRSFDPCMVCTAH